MRTGLIARKVGMTRVFDENGKHVPVTVLEVNNLQVVQKKTVETDGYNAIQLGWGSQKASRVTKPMQGHYAKAGVEPKAALAEFRVSEENLLDAGSEVKADLFEAGSYVDVPQKAPKTEQVKK